MENLCETPLCPMTTSITWWWARSVVPMDPSRACKRRGGCVSRGALLGLFPDSVGEALCVGGGAERREACVGRVHVSHPVLAVTWWSPLLTCLCRGGLINALVFVHWSGSSTAAAAPCSMTCTGEVLSPSGARLSLPACRSMAHAYGSYLHQFAHPPCPPRAWNRAAGPVTP